MNDVNDELKNLLLEQFFGIGKPKKKDLMKIEIENMGYGAEVSVTLHEDFRQILREEDKEKLGKALKHLFDAMDEIVEENQDVKAWIKSEKPKEDHDCEHCPEETKKACQDIKKSVKESVKQAFTEAANKSQGVN